jgi:hypothetical protein
MSQELGETREALGWAVWHKAEEIANANKSNVKPFYIVYAAKPDPALRGAVINGFVASGGIRDVYLTSTSRPQPAFGQLVWFVDNAQGKFELVSELSLPPDIPVDPSLLSDKSEDQLYTVMEKGKQHKALVS